MTKRRESVASLPFSTSSVTPANLLTTLQAVRGCLKTTSMLWMRALGLPVLDGVVVGDWSQASARCVSRFCAEHKFSELLLRIDKRDQRWTKRRGGYLVSRADIPGTVRKLKADGMIAVLLEPASPYTDERSLSSVVNPEEGNLVIEVVGPGFDASDVLRGDSGPHERWNVSLDSGFRMGSADRTFVIDPESYRKTVKIRLEKIGARQRSQAFPRDVLDSSESDREKLAREGAEFLRKTHQKLLLDHAESYKPITPSHLKKFAAGVGQLMSGLASYGIHLGTTSVAASYVKGRGLVFWDFFPARKQAAAALYPK